MKITTAVALLLLLVLPVGAEDSPTATSPEDRVVVQDPVETSEPAVADPVADTPSAGGAALASDASAATVIEATAAADDAATVPSPAATGTEAEDTRVSDESAEDCVASVTEPGYQIEGNLTALVPTPFSVGLKYTKLDGVGGAASCISNANDRHLRDLVHQAAQARDGNDGNVKSVDKKLPPAREPD